MSQLVVIGFDDESTAFAMRAELIKMQKEYLLKMEAWWWSPRTRKTKSGCIRQSI